MSKVIAIFGAGSGLGRGSAQFFGRKGYRVALVARNADRLEALVAELSAEGIEAAAFPTDLSDTAAALATVDAIRERFGRIDVVQYAPLNTTDPVMVPASQLDASFLEGALPLYLTTAVEVVHAVLPEMLERGEGGVFYATGGSTVDPSFVPGIAGFNSIAAAARHYIHALHGEVGVKGVQAATVVISGIIANSAAASGAGDDPAFAGIPVVAPVDIAEQIWLSLSRKDVEIVYPAPPAK